MNRPLALVTGSTVRTGRTIAATLAARGYDLRLHARVASGPQVIEAHDHVASMGASVTTVAGDLRDPSAVEGLFEGIAPRSLSALVHNVGVYCTGSLLTLDPALWDETWGANVDGFFHLVQAAQPHLCPGGGIVVLGYAGIERLAGTRTSAAYTASKVALLSLARSLALELAPRGVRVNMVSPGQLENSVDLPADVAGRVPLGRAGRVQEVADAVAWLLSDQASYVTGQNLEVAGGLLLQIRGE